CTALFDYW
nr:immunoglobulin heavy chain junction region [Mus musculus]NSM04975.1 immunoglobulin heavy chain junction region [Mus musculus]NSM08070.1 immunoglobulin heavy chain junction region [Mus musculus]